MAPLWRRYLGTSYSSPSRLGASAAGTYGANRSYILARLLEQGKMRAENLSAADLAAAAPLLGQSQKLEAEQGGGGGGIGGFLGNLGSDIWEATKGLPVGIYQTGKATGTDISDILQHQELRGGSDIVEDVVNPIVEGYKYTYGGKGAPKGSTLWSRIYENPLGPILDVATIASLGAGGVGRAGSALSKAGKISRENPLARMRSTERSPLPYVANTPEGAMQGSIPRYFSQRPLRKATQLLTDVAARNIPVVGNLQRSLMKSQQQKMDYSIKESQALGQVRREAVDPLVEPLSKLTSDELEAFQLLGRLGGENVEQFASLLGQAAREGLEGEAPEGQRLEDYAGSVDPRLAEQRAQGPSERATELATDPTKSPALMEAMSAYRERVESRIRPQLGEEEFAAKAGETLSALRERYGVEEPTAPEPEFANESPELHRFEWNKIRRAGEEEGLYVEDLLRGETVRPDPSSAPTGRAHPFAEPTIMPSEVAEGFRYREPGWVARHAAGREGGFQRDKKGRVFNPSNVTYQNLFQEPRLAFRPNADPVLAGVTRPDARQFVDLIAKHERDVIEKDFSQESLSQVALKDPETGEPIQAFTQSEVTQRYGKDWVLTHPTYPIHWYQKQTDVAAMLTEMESKGYDVGGPETMARVAAEAEDIATEAANFGARRVPGIVIPRKYAEYQRALEGASEAYGNVAGRLYARGLNFWRTWTLAMMPRWALNTAVGSFMLTTIKGVSPRQYYRSRTVRKAGGFDQPEAAGVNLGEVIGLELLESGAQGYLDQAFGIKVGPNSRWVMQKVQGIEDTFRRASFVQALDRQHRRMMEENGAIIANLERSKGPRSTDEYVDFIKENPEAVRRAVEEVNRFAYNFATLGPSERRYIRQAVPFWGWYKFISGLAYRLPVDYPGRSNVLAQLGMLGNAQMEEQYGEMPGWLQGVLPLGGGDRFRYLSTMGLNPFSQIFNPMGPEKIGGVAQLGQASPLIQSLLTAYGVDPMRGGEVPISPETLEEAGVGKDFFGALVSQATGAERDALQIAPFERVVGGLIRSFPQARIMERFRTGGRSVYPESVPWDLKPMGTKPESRFGGTPAEVFEQWVGVAPRGYDLKGWQSLAKKRARYARTRQKSDLRRLQQSLKQ